MLLYPLLGKLGALLCRRLILANHHRYTSPLWTSV
jgi:hypothetical protein